MGNQTLIPNTTQVPNVVLDEWLPRLKDSELRILLVIIRQTIGWVEDPLTGRRKEFDWIAKSQMERKTGLKRRVLSTAINGLTDLGLVEVYSEKGELLANSKDREKAGSRLFYRFRLVAPQPTLFDYRRGGARKDQGRFMHPTKETLGTTKRFNKGSGYVDKSIKRLQELKLANPIGR